MKTAQKGPGEGRNHGDLLARFSVSWLELKIQLGLHPL